MKLKLGSLTKWDQNKKSLVFHTRQNYFEFPFKAYKTLKLKLGSLTKWDQNKKSLVFHTRQNYFEFPFKAYKTSPSSIKQVSDFTSC